MLSTYVGLPYVFRGRSRKGLDCLGLVQLFYREQFGIEVPEYFYAGKFEAMDCAATIDMGADDGNWTAVTDKSYADVLVYRVLGLPTHIAIDIDKDLMLHAFQGRNSCIEHQDDWSHRLVKRYRWLTK